MSCKESNPTQNEKCTSDVTTTACDGKWYSDCLGDTPYDFIDIESAFSTVSQDSIITKIVVSELPESLINHQSEVNEDELEYFWASRFDIDNDGLKVDDLELAVAHWKGGTGPERIDQILTFVQVDVWKYTETGASQQCEASVSINGDTMTISVPRDRINDLLKIDKNTFVYYQTRYNDGNRYQDFLPEE
ncbi:MAG: hypothetical protein GF401_04160 [Chitinivibrionales bacterium]|nr:hypothetical protein [Chitinivibrionales bacterium]